MTIGSSKTSHQFCKRKKKETLFCWMCTWVVAKTPNSAAARPRASATSTSTTTALPGIPDGAASSVMETVSKAPRRRRRSPAAAAARTRSRTVAARARSGPTAASTAARRVRAQPRIVTWYTRIRTSSAVSRRSTASWRASSDGDAEGSSSASSSRSSSSSSCWWGMMEGGEWVVLDAVAIGLWEWRAGTCLMLSDE